MTILVFLVGASLVVNVAVGYLAWRATVECRAARAGALEILRELEAIRQMARPMTPVGSEPVSFKQMIGNGLVRYETTKALERTAAELENACCSMW